MAIRQFSTHWLATVACMTPRAQAVGVAAPVRPPVMPWLVHGVGKR